MSPDFITQVVADEPQVIIVCGHSVLAEPLVAALKTWQLAVMVMEPRAVTADVVTKAYKLVWVLETLTTKDIATHRVELQAAAAKLSFLIPVTTPVESPNPVMTAWKKVTSHQADVLSQLSQWFSQSSLLIGQDVLLGSQYPYVPFQVMAQAISKKVILDPSVTLYLQSWTSFCQTVSRLIINPHPDVYVIQGKKTTTTALVKLLQLHLQRYTQELMKSEPVAATEIELPISDTTPQPSATTFDADSVMSEIAQSLAHRAAVSEVMEAEPIAPIPAPQKTNKKTTAITDLRTKVTQQPTAKVTAIPPHAIPVIPAVHFQPAASVVTTSPATTPRVSTVANSTVANSTGAKANLPRTSAGKPVEPSATSQQVIEDEVMRLFQDQRSEYKVERVRQVAKTTVKTTKKLTHKKKAFMGGLVFVGIGLVVTALIGLFFISGWQLKRNLLNTLAHSSPPVPTAATLWWTKLTTWQVQAYSHIFDASHFATTMSTAELTASLPIIREHANQLDSLAETAVLQALGRKDGELVTTFSEANTVAQSLYELLSQNQARLKELPTDDLSEDQQKIIDEYDQALTQDKKALLPVQQLQPLLAMLLGKQGKRTYAVVLQNNQELRPTGGFVQAVALVTFDQGLLIDTQVFNVYDLDTKAAGTAMPPVEITQLLGEKQWFLRDSNWNPDFPTTGHVMSDFIERATGHQVDGVIGMNLIVARELLKALGPVDLPEYNEVITDRNLAERMEFHSEIQLVPSPDHPDYSTLFLNRLMQKIQQVQPDKIPTLLKAFHQSFEQKQLMISLEDQGELSTFSALGWTGELLQPSCPIQLSEVPCTVDTVAQVEANVGINKANVYIDRKITHSVELSPTLIRHQRQMVFTNKATSNAWPKGSYKNYIRLYVPTTAELTKVQVNGAPLPPTQTIVKTEQNRRVFSFLVEVPIQKSVTVDVEYTEARPAASTPFAYALFNQQQPGVENTPVTIMIKPGAGLKPSLIAPQAKLEGQTIVFDQTSSPHAFVGVKF